MGAQLPLKKGRNPIFGPCLLWPITAGYIKMPFGMEVGLRPGDFVLDGDPTPYPRRRSPSPIFGPCLLWPNGWMDQDDTGMEVSLGLRDIVLDGDPAPASLKWHSP